MAGVYDIVVAGGVESMSRVVMGSAPVWAPTPTAPSSPSATTRASCSQGVAAELVAARWNLDRTALDEYSVRSHTLAAATPEAGLFDREIIPVETPSGMVNRDETIRPNSTVEKLATLKTVFGTPELSERFPEIDGDHRGQLLPDHGRGQRAAADERERAKSSGYTPRARHPLHGGVR